MWIPNWRSLRTPSGVLLAMLVLGSSFAAEPWVRQIRAPQYFAVSVEDVDTSVEWYCKALGLTKLDDSRAKDGAWRIVNLSNDDLFVEIIRDDRHGPAGRVRGFAKVGFRVPDVDVVAGRAGAALDSRSKVLEFREHGIRILQLEDPDGNVVQLSSPLPAEPDRPE